MSKVQMDRIYEEFRRVLRTEKGVTRGREEKMKEYLVKLEEQVKTAKVGYEKIWLEREITKIRKQLVGIVE